MRSVVDPGFARRGGETPEFVARTYYLARFFAENWIKMNKKLDRDLFYLILLTAMAVLLTA